MGPAWWAQARGHGGLGMAPSHPHPLGPSPPLAQPPLKAPRVHCADRETEAQRALVLPTSPTQSPLAFPREQQFPPTPEHSGMFQKSFFNVRIPLQPLNGGVGLEPGPV